MSKEIHDAAKSLGMSTVACTVGELKTLLEWIPEDTPVHADGVDTGGYDVTTCPYVYLETFEEGLRLRHLEYEAYKHRGINALVSS